MRTSRKGAEASFTSCRDTEVLRVRSDTTHAGPVPGFWPSHLYVSELCDLQEARPSLGQQEEALLRHGDDSHAARRLDARRQLVHALVVVQVVDDLGGQVHVLGLGLGLLPEGVEDSEELGVDLLLLAWGGVGGKKMPSIGAKNKKSTRRLLRSPRAACHASEHKD